MLSGIRDTFRGLRLLGKGLGELQREMKQLRSEWDDELADMRSMWDKLQLWAARQAKRDKAMSANQVDQLVGADPAVQTQFDLNADVRSMTKEEAYLHKAELRRVAAASKPQIRGMK